MSHLRLPRLPAVLSPGWRWAGLIAWAALATVNAQQHGGRLEPAERARLRHELREQAWGHRHAERAAHYAVRVGAWQDPAGTPARPAGGLAPVGPGAEPAPRLASVGDGTPQVPGVGAEAMGERSHQRLSPDERRYLRWQLHEERQRRRQQGELPQR